MAPIRKLLGSEREEQKVAYEQVPMFTIQNGHSTPPPPPEENDPAAAAVVVEDSDSPRSNLVQFFLDIAAHRLRTWEQWSKTFERLTEIVFDTRVQERLKTLFHEHHGLFVGWAMQRCDCHTPPPARNITIQDHFPIPNRVRLCKFHQQKKDGWHSPQPVTRLTLLVQLDPFYPGTFF
jgi:hypothetical protein